MKVTIDLEDAGAAVAALQHSTESAERQLRHVLGMSQDTTYSEETRQTFAKAAEWGRRRLMALRVLHAALVDASHEGVTP